MEDIFILREEVFDQPHELLRRFQFEAAAWDAAGVLFLWDEETQFVRRCFLLLVQRDESQIGAPASKR